MNKKIIILLSVILFSSSLVLFANNETTIVVGASDLDISFVLEAKPDGSWVSADGEEITNSSWDARGYFDVDLRVRATAGSFGNTQESLTVNVGIGNLFRGGFKTELGNEEDYFDAGVGYLVDESVDAGSKFVLGTVDYDNNKIPFTTKKNHIYGLANHHDNDSISFKVAYGGNVNAPAGTYKSDITISYIANV